MVIEGLDILDSGVEFPYMGPLNIVICIGLSSEHAIDVAGDPDNYEKGIFDAMKGLVYPDDKLKYIRDHRTFGVVAGCRAEVGTKISLYRFTCPVRPYL